MPAAAKGDADQVAWLIERGAELDHTAKYGLTALMLAVVRGHVDVVRKPQTPAPAPPGARDGRAGVQGKNRT